MDLQQLADELRRMYEAAPYDERVVMIHLFGIKYASEISRFTPTAIVRAAELPSSYGTEVNKGRNLARYVELKRR